MHTLLISTDTLQRFLKGRGAMSNDEYINKLIEAEDRFNTMEVARVEVTVVDEEKPKPKPKPRKRNTKKENSDAS